MPREPRAILFDLDDTLYPHRRFVLSGFAAASRYLESGYGVSAADAFRVLSRAFRGGARGRELQRCLDYFSLPASLVPTLVHIIRTHRPSLRLPDSARDVLETLRADWRIGIVTNGLPAVQARKVDVLGLRPLVDVVVYATEYGSGRGKPDPEPFEAAVIRLGVEPDRAVFVGDSEDCDVRGAAAVGLQTVRISPRATLGPGDLLTEADTVVGSLRDVPVAVAPLIAREWRRHVA